MQRLTVLLALLTLPLLTSCGGRSPSLVIESPQAGSAVSGQFAVRAQLNLPEGSRAEDVRFTIDGHATRSRTTGVPQIAPGVTIDADTLPAGRHRFAVGVSFNEVKDGRRTARTLQKISEVVVFKAPKPGGNLPKSDWQRVFFDDFSSAQRSLKSWNLQRRDWIKGARPYNNHESAGYSPENVRIRDGQLQIRTSKTPTGGEPRSTGSVNTHHNFSFRHGYIEARIRYPACTGCWPAFWLLPSADRWPPEIDIFEAFNTAKDDTPWTALHWPAKTKSGERFRHEPLRSSPSEVFAGSWHSWAMLWTPDLVEIFLDGRSMVRWTTRAEIPQEAMYPIIQLALQKRSAVTTGSTLEVDRVAAWQLRD